MSLRLCARVWTFRSIFLSNKYQVCICGTLNRPGFTRDSIYLTPRPVHRKLESSKADLYEQADSLIEQNRLQEACQIYQQLNDMDPNDVEAWCMGGVLDSELGNLNLAVEKLHKALALAPHHSMSNYSLANIHLNKGRIEEALSCCLRAVHQDSQFAEAWLLLGGIQGQLGQYAASEKSGKKAVTLAPDRVEAHLLLARALKSQGKTIPAAESFKKALQISPHSTDASLGLGLIYRETGDLAHAVKYFEKSLQTAPDHPAVYDELVAAYCAQGNLGAAESISRKAVLASPRQATAHNRLGGVLHLQGVSQEALQSFHKANRLDPGYAAPIRNLATVYWELGKPTEALAYCLNLVRLAPDNLHYRQNFVDALNTVLPDAPSEELLIQIKRCFEITGIEHQKLVKPVTRILKNTDELCELIELARRGANTEFDNSISDARFTAIFQHGLFHDLLIHSVLADADFEILLRTLRKSFLRLAVTEKYPLELTNNYLGFAVALACQCFNNEYVYWHSSDERTMVEELSNTFMAYLETGSNIMPVFEFKLAVLCMYKPLHMHKWEKYLVDPDQIPLSTVFQRIVKRQWHDCREEFRIKSEIEAITEINNTTSLAVQVQYEESPYPRWLGIGFYSPKHYMDVIREMFTHYTPANRDNKPVRVLNAGCGTGRHAIMSATRFRDAEILAVDLSLSSLAYAKRSANELGINNISFKQADILQLDSLNQRFHIIEAGGVLHHIEQTEVALKILVDLLLPGGIMMIGLYSEIARINVHQCAKYLATNGFGKTIEDVRDARQVIFALDEDRPEQRVLQSPDFYSLSSCRDLLFHAHEHCYRLPTLAEILQRNHLTFLGFEIGDPKIKNNYKYLFPEDTNMTDLASWDSFEKRYPRTFAGMYLMWCQKVLNA